MDSEDWVAPLPRSPLLRCVTWRGGEDPTQLLRAVRRLAVDVVLLHGAKIESDDWKRLRSPALPILYYAPQHGLSIISRRRLRNQRVCSLGPSGVALVAEAAWGLVVCATVRDPAAVRRLVSTVGEQTAIVGGDCCLEQIQHWGWCITEMGGAASTRDLRCFAAEPLPLGALSEWELLSTCVRGSGKVCIVK